MSSFQYAHSMKSGAAQPQTNLRLAWLAPLFLLAIAIIGPNTGLALYACVVLGIGTSLLWRPGEPPILFLIFLYQWAQSAIGLFYANLLRLPIDLVPEYEGQHRMAVFLLLTGLLVLTLTIRLAAGPSIRGHFPRVQAFVVARPLRFWIRVFIVAWIFSAVCTSAGWALGGLRQVLLSLANVEWVAFMLLTLATFAVPNRSKVPWILVFGFLFAVSVGGYFSSFKEVFLYALIGLMASNVRFRFRVLLPAAILVSILLSLGLVWTAIKKEYRDFVNQGSKQQVVLVSYSKSVAEIASLVSNLNGQDLSAAADDMMRRLMYFKFFGAVLDRVPSALPYADGQIWGDAIGRPFMPRLLFPNKSAVNDSDLTNRYTGFRVATASEGASISLGYMAEAYIDFGYIFMFLPIAGLGLFLGTFYRRLMSLSGPGVAFGVALAPFALMPAHLSETSSLKLVPALGLSIVSCWLILNFLAPRFFGLPRQSRQIRNILPVQRQRA
jgi:hypothetical protein